MGTVNLRRVLDHSAAEIWPHIQDFENIQRILPMISHADLTSEQSCGLGAERICYMRGGGFALHERVLDWKEGESYTIEIWKTSMPMMERSVTTVGVKPVGPNRAEVFFVANYSLKYGWLGKLADLLMVNVMMKWMTSGLFGALDRQVRAAQSAATDAGRATARA